MEIELSYSNMYAVISIFRVLAYVVGLEYATQVKVEPKACEDKKVQEVAFALCRNIRLFMTFRSVITVWSLFLPEDTMKIRLCHIQLAQDIYMMYVMIQKFVLKSKGVLVHQFNIPPLTLQTFIVLPGIIYHLYLWQENLLF